MREYVEYVSLDGEDSINYSIYHYNKKTKKKTKPLSVKTNKRADKGGLFLIFIMISCFILMAVLGEYFTNGSWFASSQTEPVEYYGVGYNCGDNYDLAREKANQMTTFGAAGFILTTSNEQYIVLGAVYNNRADAQSILDKPNNKEFLNYIYTFEAKEYEYDRIPFKYRSIAKETFTYKDIIYKGLYDITIAIDTGESDHNAILADLESIIEDFNDKKKIFTNSANDTTNNEVIQIKAELNAVESILNNLKSHYAIDNLVAEIRYSYIMVLNSYCLLMQ